MKFIEDIHELVNFLAGKNIATKQPPEKIDMVLYEVVIDLFNGYYDNYVKTQKISDYLLPFKRTSTLVMTAGIAELPATYQHVRALRSDLGKKIDIVEDKFWDGRVNSKVCPPSVPNNIIARIEVPESDSLKRILQVVPVQGSVVLEFFKAPDKPKYAFTLTGTRYVYDEENSIDVEFSPLLFNDIKKRVLSGLGINLRDRDLTNYSEQAKATEQAK
ncbi:MAG: hypothetical protein WKF87_06755 [Chryseolinea sp.]